MTDAKKATLLTSHDCGVCEEQKAVMKANPDLAPNIREVSLDSAEGKELIQKHGIKYLPALVTEDGKVFQGEHTEREMCEIIYTDEGARTKCLKKESNPP